MLAFTDLLAAFQALRIPRGCPVIVHASIRSFGAVRGGAETVLAGLAAAFEYLIVPAFTYKTMITPSSGPPENAIRYGANQGLNRMAQFFRPDMPVDKMMGVFPEIVRRYPQAKRSTHPILSFAGLNAHDLIAAQTLDEPLAPIARLAENQGWVLLLGVDQTVNTTIHQGELLAGRRQFVRWALTPQGVITCPGFPGCSNGFKSLAPRLEPLMRAVRAGGAEVQAFPAWQVIEAARQEVEANRMALLCSSAVCQRCKAIRRAEGSSASG